MYIFIVPLNHLSCYYLVYDHTGVRLWYNGKFWSNFFTYEIGRERFNKIRVKLQISWIFLIKTEYCLKISRIYSKYCKIQKLALQNCLLFVTTLLNVFCAYLANNAINRKTYSNVDILKSKLYLSSIIWHITNL